MVSVPSNGVSGSLIKCPPPGIPQGLPVASCEWKPEQRLAPPLLSQLLHDDGYLCAFEGDFRYRYTQFKHTLDRITENEGSILEFANSYERFGPHFKEDGSMEWWEYAPAADGVFLRGEFNQWNRVATPFTKLEHGKWKLSLPPASPGVPVIKHLDRLRLSIASKDGQLLDRISPWATYVVQPEGSLTYDHVIWNPEVKYQFKHPAPPTPKNLKIYEAHVGISSHEATVATYRHFRENVLPHIAGLGYNCIQLMAIMEHAYYGCFGYQVTSFFAASSRYGDPDELKQLVDQAHSYGLIVLLDVVHSHAAKNVLDGLNNFDGSDSCLFHSGHRGNHSLWDSRLFDYRHWETSKNPEPLWKFSDYFLTMTLSNFCANHRMPMQAAKTISNTSLKRKFGASWVFLFYLDTVSFQGIGFTGKCKETFIMSLFLQVCEGPDLRRSKNTSTAATIQHCRKQINSLKFAL